MYIIEITFAFLMLILGNGCNKNEPLPPNNKPDSKEIAFSNPVFTPTFADPTILFNSDDDYYYAFGTQDYWGSSDHLVPVIRSRDLVLWTFIGDAFTERLIWNPKAFIWAPEVFKWDNKIFMFYSASVWGDSNPGIGQAWALKPSDNFTDLGKLFNSDDIGVQNSIDPCFFHDETTNKIYLLSRH
jgi:arabinan endo-1,5-alpha-L-arabinosidase